MADRTKFKRKSWLKTEEDLWAAVGAGFYQWAVLEGCQADLATKALSALLEKADDDSWTVDNLVREVKVK